MRVVDGVKLIMLGECGEVPLDKLSEFTFIPAGKARPPTPRDTRHDTVRAAAKRALAREALGEAVESAFARYDAKREVELAAMMAEETTTGFRDNRQLYDAHRHAVSLEEVASIPVPNNTMIEYHVKALMEADAALRYADAVEQLSKMRPELWER